MRTGRTLIWIAAAAALACAACSQPDFIGRDRQALDSAPGADESWPTIPGDEVEDLPPCAEVEIPGGRIVVYIVQDGGGLLALAVDDALVCVDDAEGMEEAGVPEQAIPDERNYTDPPDDGVLIPADGTPLPAGPSGGISDGTPLPA